jgi:hypothetical protein
VAVFLGGDVADEFVERPLLVPSAKIEGLERVVHQGRHLAEFASHQDVLVRMRRTIFLESLRTFGNAMEFPDWLRQQLLTASL